MPVSMPKLHRSAFGSIREDFDAYWFICIGVDAEAKSPQGNRWHCHNVHSDALSLYESPQGKDRANFRLADVQGEG